MDLLDSEDPVDHEVDSQEETEQDHAVAVLDDQLQALESRILTSLAEGESTSTEHVRFDKQKQEDEKRRLDEEREDAMWAIPDLSTILVGPGCAALETFQIKKWREILQLAKLMSVPCFHAIRAAGDDRSLYEGFFRAFPHQLVTKARFTSVIRHIYGISVVAMNQPRVKPRKTKDIKYTKGNKLSDANNNTEDKDSARSAALLMLDRQLDKLQHCCQRSDGNVPVLNWRTLLIAIRMFQEPLLTVREHLTWAFSVFSSSGYLELNESDAIDADDVDLILTHPTRNPAASRLVSERLRAALSMLPPTSTESSSRITYRVFKQLIQFPPLRTLLNRRVTLHTSEFDELSVCVYRDFVYRSRRREHNKRVLRRLRYFNETKATRLCFHTWAQFVNDTKAARATVTLVHTIVTRVKQRAAFAKLRRHALTSIAALEIQRVFRGMQGRMRAEVAWRKIQAVLAVQGAFRMRAHFMSHLRKLRRQNLLAIRIQRLYRGRLGRIKARQKLLTHYYREMAAIQQEREAFRVFVRDEMARRLQRAFRQLAANRQRAQRMKEEVERHANELEMIKLSEDAYQQAARHRREVTAKYDKLREEADQKEKRRRIDDIEKQKIVHRRRQRQWDTFKADKVAHKEALKHKASESSTRLRNEWEAKSTEKSRKRANLVEQLLQCEEIEGEWKKMHNQLHRRVRERSKQLTAKYRANGVAMSKKEIIDHAQHEILAEENEEEHCKAENEWLQLEADFLQQLDAEEDERKLAENAEERVARQRSALRIQCAFRMFKARKLLRQMLREVYSKEFNGETQGARYRNTVTGKTSTRKPAGFGTEEIEYENRWVVMLDNVLGEPYFYNAHQMRQSWDKPQDCELCGICSSSPSAEVAFAAVWNSRDGVYLCQACYETDYAARSGAGEFQGDEYVVYDGSRPNGQ